MAESESQERLRGGRTRDARGRKVEMLDPYRLRLFRRYDVIPEEPLGGLASDLGSGIEHFPRGMVRVISVLWCLAALAYLVIGIGWACRGQLGNLLGRPGIMMAQLWFFPMVFWQGAKHHRFTRIRRIMLEHLRCPHCGYDLRMLPVDPQDGATICPECGCAWALDTTRHDHASPGTTAGAGHG